MGMSFEAPSTSGCIISRHVPLSAAVTQAGRSTPPTLNGLSIFQNGSTGLVDETVLSRCLSTNRPLHVPLKELYHKHGQHHCFFDDEKASLDTVLEMIESVVSVQWTWKGTTYSHQRYARGEGLTSRKVYGMSQDTKHYSEDQIEIFFSTSNLKKRRSTAKLSGARRGYQASWRCLLKLSVVGARRGYQASWRCLLKNKRTEGGRRRASLGTAVQSH